MARTTQVTLPYQTVVAVSETAVFVPFTGWMPAGRVQRQRPTRELAARTNVLEAAVAYQIGTYLGSHHSEATDCFTTMGCRRDASTTNDPRSGWPHPERSVEGEP